MILWTSSIWPPYEYAIITKFHKNRATFFINVQFWAQLQIFINSLYSILQNLLKGLSFFFFYYDILWQFFPQIQCRGTLGWVKCSLLTLAISDCSRRCYDCLGHQGWTCRNVSLLWNNSRVSKVVQYPAKWLIERGYQPSHLSVDDSMPCSKSYCESFLRNGTCKTCLWKKYIFLYECRQNQGKKSFWNCTLAFQIATKLALAAWPIRLALLMQFISALKRTIQNVKNSFYPNFVFFFMEQKIFFQETYFAFSISYSKYTV